MHPRHFSIICPLRHQVYWKRNADWIHLIPFGFSCMRDCQWKLLVIKACSAFYVPSEVSYKYWLPIYFHMMPYTNFIWKLIISITEQIISLVFWFQSLGSVMSPLALFFFLGYVEFLSFPYLEISFSQQFFIFFYFYHPVSKSDICFFFRSNVIRTWSMGSVYVQLIY